MVITTVTSDVPTAFLIGFTSGFLVCAFIYAVRAVVKIVKFIMKGGSASV